MLKTSKTNARQLRLVASLQQRFRLAEESRDARAKQELFREAVYLGIQPQLFTDAP
jgi:hypothetical protein|tara:strand:+ start:215 stop:382 length:168 start_codon:yes stop_codon:yes gene_type:complete